MTSIKNHKTLSALVTISAIAVVLTGSVHMAFAFRGFSTPSPGNSIMIDNQGVNEQTDTSQTQECITASGTSPISGSCIANSNDHITESGSILKK